MTSPIPPTATAPRRASRRFEPSGEPSSLAVTDESPNGSVPRLGRPYPRDYGSLLGRPYPPQGTFAATGGRPEHGRADGGTGLGQQAPAGLALLFAGPLTPRSATGRGVPRAVGAARGCRKDGRSSWVLRRGGRRRPSRRV